MRSKEVPILDGQSLRGYYRLLGAKLGKDATAGKNAMELSIKNQFISHPLREFQDQLQKIALDAIRKMIRNY